MKILIADDHAIVRKGLIQILLEKYPFAFIGEASEADELIGKVANQKWDIVICDISMPGRSGIDVLHEIKALAPGLPVLIMSMYSEDQFALRAFKAGAWGYLGKDTIHTELIAAVQKILSGNKYITPSIAEKMALFLDTKTLKHLHEILSNREFEVFMLLVSGKSSSAIAEKLSLSPTTISTYRIRILEKMHMQSNAELIKYSIEKKLI